MTDPNPYRRYEPGRAAPPGTQPSSLADVLDRVLDKGLVIAGDISISLASVELITIKIRLLVASVERAREMGIDWWSRDPSLTGGAQELPSKTQLEEMEPEELAEQNRALMERVQELESRLSGLLSQPESVATKSSSVNITGMMAPRHRPSGGGGAGVGDESAGGENSAGSGEQAADAEEPAGAEEPEE